MRQVRLIRSYVAPLSNLRYYDISCRLSISSSARVNGNGIDIKQQRGRRSTHPVGDNSRNINCDDKFSFLQPQFDNTPVIYASKSTSELIRAYFVFGACSLDVVVNNQTKVPLFYWPLSFIASP